MINFQQYNRSANINFNNHKACPTAPLAPPSRSTPVNASHQHFAASGLPHRVDLSSTLPKFSTQDPLCYHKKEQ